MSKSMTTIYLEDELKLKLKEEAKAKSKNGARYTVTSIVNDLILEHFRKEITHGETTLVVGNDKPKPGIFKDNHEF